MANLSQLTIPVKNPSTGTVTPQTFNLAGSDSGGHTIQNQSGTAMAQRTNLKFNNATVVDDATNDVTIVTPTGDPTNFVGTIEEWEALSQAEQDMYDSVDLTDDYTDVIDDLENLSTQITTLEDYVNEQISELANDYEEVSLVNSTWKGSTITSMYGHLVRNGKQVTITLLWAGSATASQPIITLPAKYRPKSSAFGAGTLMVSNVNKPGIYLVGNAAGAVVQQTTTAAATQGAFVMSYLIN